MQAQPWLALDGLRDSFGRPVGAHGVTPPAVRTTWWVCHQKFSYSKSQVCASIEHGFGRIAGFDEDAGGSCCDFGVWRGVTEESSGEADAGFCRVCRSGV